MKLHMLGWLMAGLVASAPALAELKIGFVDPRPVLDATSGSNAGKQHVAELEKFKKDKGASIKKEQEKLQALQQSFQKEALTLSDAQKQQKDKEFQEKVVAFNKMQQDAERELRKRDSEFAQRVNAEIKKAVEEVAREEKINLVMNRAEVLYTDTGVDLTEKVVKKLQTALQKLEKTNSGKKK